MDNATAPVEVEIPAPRTAFQVPAENIQALQGRIDKLNRRVALLAKRGYEGIEPIAIEVGKPYPVPQKCSSCGCEGAALPAPGSINFCEKCHGRPLPDRIFHEVKLLAPKAPKVEGWEFVAALTHMEGVGAVLRVCPGAEVSEGELAKYRTASSENCDHCKQRRRRTDTFIVRRIS